MRTVCSKTCFALDLCCCSLVLRMFDEVVWVLSPGVYLDLQAGGPQLQGSLVVPWWRTHRSSGHKDLWSGLSLSGPVPLVLPRRSP